MWGYREPFAPPVSPFQTPVSPPSVDPDAGGDFVSVTVAREWLPFVLGALQVLTLQATWAGSDDDKLLAQQRACLLIDQFAQGGEIAVQPSIAPQRAVYETISTPPGSNIASAVDTWYNLIFEDNPEAQDWITIHPTTGAISLLAGIYHFRIESYNGTGDLSYLRFGYYDQSYFFGIGPLAYDHNSPHIDLWVVVPSDMGSPWCVQQFFHAADAGGRRKAFSLPYLVHRLTVQRYQYE